jgi:hypothetical protein
VLVRSSRRVAAKAAELTSSIAGASAAVTLRRVEAVALSTALDRLPELRRAISAASKKVRLNM